MTSWNQAHSSDKIIHYHLIEETPNTRVLYDSNGYSYSHSETTVNGNNSLWICTMRNSSYACNSSVQQEGSTFKSSETTHTHSPKPDEYINVVIRRSLKAKVEQGVMRSFADILNGTLDDLQIPKCHISGVWHTNLYKYFTKLKQDINSADDEDNNWSDSLSSLGEEDSLSLLESIMKLVSPSMPKNVVKPVIMPPSEVRSCLETSLDSFTVKDIFDQLVETVQDFSEKNHTAPATQKSVASVSRESGHLPLMKEELSNKYAPDLILEGLDKVSTSSIPPVVDMMDIDSHVSQAQENKAITQMENGEHSSLSANESVGEDMWNIQNNPFDKEAISSCEKSLEDMEVETFSNQEKVSDLPTTSCENFDDQDPNSKSLFSSFPDPVINAEDLIFTNKKNKVDLVNTENAESSQDSEQNVQIDQMEYNHNSPIHNDHNTDSEQPSLLSPPENISEMQLESNTGTPAMEETCDEESTEFPEEKDQPGIPDDGNSRSYPEVKTPETAQEEESNEFIDNCSVPVSEGTNEDNDKNELTEENGITEPNEHNSRNKLNEENSRNELSEHNSKNELNEDNSSNELNEDNNRNDLNDENNRNEFSEENSRNELSEENSKESCSQLITDDNSHLKDNSVSETEGNPKLEAQNDLENDLKENTETSLDSDCKTPTEETSSKDNTALKGTESYTEENNCVPSEETSLDSYKSESDSCTRENSVSGSNENWNLQPQNDLDTGPKENMEMEMCETKTNSKDNTNIKETETYIEKNEIKDKTDTSNTENLKENTVVMEKMDNSDNSNCSEADSKDKDSPVDSDFTNSDELSKNRIMDTEESQSPHTVVPPPIPSTEAKPSEETPAGEIETPKTAEKDVTNAKMETEEEGKREDGGNDSDSNSFGTMEKEFTGFSPHEKRRNEDDDNEGGQRKRSKGCQEMDNNNCMDTVPDDSNDEDSSNNIIIGETFTINEEQLMELEESLDKEDKTTVSGVSSDIQIDEDADAQSKGAETVTSHEPEHVNMKKQAKSTSRKALKTNTHSSKIKLKTYTKGKKPKRGALFKPIKRKKKPLEKRRKCPPPAPSLPLQVQRPHEILPTFLQELSGIDPALVLYRERTDEEGNRSKVACVSLHETVLEWAFVDTLLSSFDNSRNLRGRLTLPSKMNLLFPKDEVPQRSRAFHPVQLGPSFPFSMAAIGAPEGEGEDEGLPFPLEQFVLLCPSAVGRRRAVVGGTASPIRTVTFADEPLEWAFKETFLSTFEDSPILSDLLGLDASTKKWPDVAEEILAHEGVDYSFPFACPFVKKHLEPLLFHELSLVLPATLLHETLSLPPLPHDIERRLSTERDALVRLLALASFYKHASCIPTVRSNRKLSVTHASIVASFRPLVISQANTFAYVIKEARMHLLKGVTCQDPTIIPALIRGPVPNKRALIFGNVHKLEAAVAKDPNNKLQYISH